jgi:long-chain acyl-CoA synthetase
MRKIWLDSYPPGVPGEIRLEKCATLCGLLAWVRGGYGEQEAFSNQGATLTWERVDALSAQFAAWLNQLGLGKGDRIAIMLPNLLQYPVALFGALRAGCVVVNVNPQYTARELQYQLADSGAVAIVVLDNFAHTLERAIEATALRHVITTGVGDLLNFPKGQIVNLMVKHVRHMVPDWHIEGTVAFTEALSLGAALPVPDVEVRPADTALLQYTGGTTGVPKGAILTHRNLVANIEQAAAWVRGVLVEGDETAVVPLPIHHIMPMTLMLAFCRLGARIVLVTNPHDIPAFVRELRSTRFSVLIGVNTLFKALLESPDIGKLDSNSMKVVFAGGMALQREVAERWYRMFGAPIVEGYGLTEASPIVCANPLRAKPYTGYLGLPLPSTDVALMDDAGNEVPLGEIGEICVRGPQVMQGYWNMPDETERAFTAGGWLRTGDLGTMNGQGYVKLVDRKKDVIMVSGFTVFPSEVEDVAERHPGVFETAAIAAQDAHGDDVVKLVVVRRNPALTAEEIVEHCRQSLSTYKVPRVVSFRSDPLPRSNVGKVLRRVVAEQEARQAAGAPAG